MDNIICAFAVIASAGFVKQVLLSPLCEPLPIHLTLSSAINHIMLLILLPAAPLLRPSPNPNSIIDTV